MVRNGRTDMVWGVNGETFDGESRRVVPLGGVEDWLIVNNSTEQHPFHLHTNHFQIVSRGYGFLSSVEAAWNATVSEGRSVEQATFRIGDWRDTISVPAPGWVRIRWRADGYTGKSLAHCHVFSHSSTGMAMAFDIV